MLCCVYQEWCGFGHQFRARSGSDSEASPVFIQFLDATYQLLRQYVILDMNKAPSLLPIFRSSIIFSPCGVCFSCS